MSDIYIGLMSGTSLDAIDAAVIDFSHGIRILGTHSQPISPSLRSRILALCQPSHDEIDRMGALDRELGEHFASAALAALHTSGHGANQICAIGSHGQTIRHRPHGAHGFSLQIADPNTIAERTGITVIADFRRRDIAASGQGAPLVPAFHASQFSHPSRHRIVLNLGGIANITLLPAGQPQHTSGFDTGPANILMDAWSQQHTGQPYDKNGQWAASGTVQPALLHALLQHPFFAQPAPKSTGREDFNLAWLQTTLTSLANSTNSIGGSNSGNSGSSDNTDRANNINTNISPADTQATLLELTASSIAHAIQHTALHSGDLLLCGGGAFNTTLSQRLQTLLPTWSQHSTADFGLSPAWVEATAFAWLARETQHRRPSNLPAVTGATGPRILGGIYPA